MGGSTTAWLNGIGQKLALAGILQPQSKQSNVWNFVSGVTADWNEAEGRWDLSFSGGDAALPEVDSGDNGSILKVVGGVWTVAPATNYDITSFSTTTLVETSQSVTPSFTAGHNRTPVTLVLTNNANGEAKDVHGTPTLFSTSIAVQRTTPNQTYQYTLTGSDGINSDVATVTITWGQKNFWGVSTTPADTEAFVEALATSALDTNVGSSFTVNASGSNKIYFAHPTRYGTPTFTVGGFAGGFILRSSTISVTNAQGYTENYSLWESVSIGLGSTAVVVT